MAQPQISTKSNNITLCSLFSNSKKPGTFPRQFVQFNPKIRHSSLNAKKSTAENPSVQQKESNEKNPYILNSSKKLFDISFKPLNKGLFQVSSNHEKQEPSNIPHSKENSDLMDIEKQNDHLNLKKRHHEQENMNMRTKKFKLLNPQGSVNVNFNNSYSQNSPTSEEISFTDNVASPMDSITDNLVDHHSQTHKTYLPEPYNMNQIISDEAEFSDDECNVDEIQEFFVQHTGKLASSLEELAGEMEECKDNLDDLSVKLLMINNEILLMNNPILHDERTKNIDNIMQRFYEE